MAAQQEATRVWWDEHKRSFDVFVSEVVIEEASFGDEDAAQRRMAALKGIAALEITNEARELAKELMAGVPLPEKAEIDALHIEVATVNAMDFLLTWNCRHTANAALRIPIDTSCRSAGYEPLVICTPFELME